MTRLHVVLALAAALFPAMASAELPPIPLEQEIGDLDRIFFDSFNKCDQPGELEKHAAFLDPKLEFYHDEGGVTWTAEDYLKGVRENVCGKFARELEPGTMKVYPLKDFGALSTGTHRFCRFDTGRCEGEAEFAIVWRHDADQWRVTRVLSYGHRPLPERPRPLPSTPQGAVAANPK